MNFENHNLLANYEKRVEEINNTKAEGRVKCEFLNIREKPTIASKVKNIVKKDDVLIFEADTLKNTWLKLCKNEGYCLAQYIDIDESQNNKL